MEEHTDALTVVNTANGLGEDIANLEDLQLGAFLEVLFLGHGVGGDDLVNRTGVDTLHSISREYTVGDECIDLLSAFLLQKLGGASDGLRIVTSGLTAGERIVVNGLQRIRPGATVVPEAVPMTEKSELKRGPAKTEIAQR